MNFAVNESAVGEGYKSFTFCGSSAQDIILDGTKRKTTTSDPIIY